MSALYNEIDPFAAAWLRELIREGHIRHGEVDGRSIVDLRPADLAGQRQVHLFAGIGVWSYALRRAGWGDDRSVWTASFPCQPFSAAGKGEGQEDVRHLWPVGLELIRACQPPVIFGEQVSSPLAIGRDCGPEVRALWEREATLRVLEERIGRNIAILLQGMPEYGRAGMGCGSPLSASEPCGQADVWREGASSGQGDALRSHTGMATASNGGGDLRSDGHSVRHGGQSGVEHAFAGSDLGRSGLHEVEHAAGDLRLECGVRHLGREQAFDDRLRDLCSAQRHVAGTLEQTRRSIQEAGGWSWFGALQADLEGAGYAVGALDTCAAGVGAPHIRQRLYWCAVRMADANGGQRDGIAGGERCVSDRQAAGREQGDCGASSDSSVDGMAHPESLGLHQQRRAPRGSDASGRQGHPEQSTNGCGHDWPGPTNGIWRDADWLGCRDGKWRPVEPGTFPLAHGATARVGRLRGYGNALNAEQATVFAQSVMGALDERRAAA